MRNPIYHVKHLAIAILMGLNITATAQQINHPSLLFTADRIMSAKQRIESEPPFAQAWEQIKKGAETELGSDNLHSMERLAFVYTMTNDSRYARKIKKLLFSIANGEPWTDHEQFTRIPSWRSELNMAHAAYQIAMGYDAIYNYLTPKERQEITDGIYRLIIEPLLGDWVTGTTRIHSLNSMGHNWWAVCACNGGLLALAMSNESEEARKGAEAVLEALPEWFEFAGSELQIRPSNFDRKAGGLYESVTYAEFGISNALLFRLAWMNVHPDSELEEIPQINKLANFFCHVAYPGNNDLRSVNFGDHGIYDTGKRTLLLAYAMGYESAEILWYLNQMSPRQHAAAYGLNTPIGFLYAIDASEYTSPIPNLPKSQLWADFGWATMRNSWEKDATLLAVKSGFSWNHAHADANSFIIFHNGVDILKDAGTCNYGKPEYRDYFFQSDAHNVVKFNGQGQPHEQQDFASTLPGYLCTMLDGDNIKYILANGTGPTSDLFSRNYRHFLWIDNIIYIIDDIKSHQAGHFEWLWHPGGNVKMKEMEMTITNGNSSVVVRPLYPRTLSPVDSERESLYWEKIVAPKDHLEGTEEYYSFHLPSKVNKVMSMSAIILKESAGQGELPVIERRQGENWMGVRVTSQNKITDIYLNQLADGRRMDQPSIIHPDGWTTDAYLLAISYTPGSDPTQSKEIFICHGSMLHRDNTFYLSSLSKLNVISRQLDNVLDLQVSGQPRINFGIRSSNTTPVKVNNRDFTPTITDGLIKIKYKED
ncbi:heparinase II/III domain-containing protein [Petrimonas mucosa]|uniref:Heparinase II/III-like protein n=2 Tax=Petrimonas mucosa TaxID=1642646 RepID=A0A1G4G3T7_9BACT|nr:heparinase II/III family protein [Petrimonas mucosa]SCM55416.1 Heparinase II/III-like protein {ECO:0000313/EMBL:EEZ22509,1} [Petrimonas mucosa]